SRGGEKRERYLLLGGERREFLHCLRQQRRQVDRLPLEARRFGEEHQVGDHLVRAERLRVDGGKLAPPLGIALVGKKGLGSREDFGQRVFEIVAQAVGELIEAGDLFPLQLAREVGFECLQARQRREQLESQFRSQRGIVGQGLQLRDDL